jgi:hypothetical protein
MLKAMIIRNAFNHCAFNLSHLILFVKRSMSSLNCPSPILIVRVAKLTHIIQTQARMKHPETENIRQIRIATKQIAALLNSVSWKPIWGFAREQ